ncbi:P-type conjugative transfer protein VirB9 [Pontixanthobacter gangjinensis]|uniref:Type VI secretion protein n=1 Tax=Pontixanthobacter gangjinensis TaxID=1028742 RepID=A0A6I4SS46_9SPHN|nr:TrbG/VirB9 family P-type conjugative transfer protein [Pontixanthobacter gangjinensis]MXO57767.1 type VI secretion protein [Pontixanthobacter gangjinensis]
MIRALKSAPFLALALGALSSPSLADDPRLVERLYDPTEVVRIEGKTKVQATIAFAEDERIENVAIGDSQAWQVTPNKRANVLFIKPLTVTARTNMTVITDRHTYLFDLVASQNAKPLYVLRFTYPEPIKLDVEEPSLVGSPNDIELAAATDPYAVVDPAALNFEWGREGDRDLMPQQAYDDGYATFLVWDRGRPVPAILITDAAGTEGPVNFSVRAATIVVDGVPPQIILRSGKDTAILTNNGPVRSIGTEASLARSEYMSDGEGK